jgi:hypothetical protein
MGFLPSERLRENKMSRTSIRAMPTQSPNDVARIHATQYGLLLAEVDEIRTRMSGTGLISAPGLVIGSTDDQIANVAFNFHVAGLAYIAAAVAAGTAPTAQTVTADKWALYRLSVSISDAKTVTPAAGNVAGYATEALAIAALPATPAGEADMGYVTVKTKAATAWIGATDALEGGAAGNPASETNYYDADNTIGTEQAKTLNFMR